jgi:hypothetical protein
MIDVNIYYIGQSTDLTAFIITKDSDIDQGTVTIPPPVLKTSFMD